MATYLIGDIHGCYDELTALLKIVNFSSDSDVLWLTGDLVLRGYNSLGVLRYVKSLGNSVKVVLGNHDLYLILAYLSFIRKKNIENQVLLSILEAPDINELLDWLCCQPVLQIDEDKKLVMTHAGIHPQWNLNIAKKHAFHIKKKLAESSCLFSFLEKIFDDQNSYHQNIDSKLGYFRFIFNVFTRMRYCFSNGQLDMKHKDIPNKNISLLTKPWFNFPSFIVKEGYNIVFGHWSSLRGKGTPSNFYALDTGCCWGDKLTCLCWENKKYYTQNSIIRKDTRTN